MKSHLFILACLMPALASAYIRKEFEGWDCYFALQSPHLITYKNADGSIEKLCGGGVKCLKPGTVIPEGKTPADLANTSTFVMCPYPKVDCSPTDANVCAQTPVENFDIFHWTDSHLKGTGQLGNDFK